MSAWSGQAGKEQVWTVGTDRNESTWRGVDSRHGAEGGGWVWVVLQTATIVSCANDIISRHSA